MVLMGGTGWFGAVSATPPFFPNNTWAHGGPQLIKRLNWPVQPINWGELVNRGGGSKNDAKADLESKLLLIEFGVGNAKCRAVEMEAEYRACPR
jgi:hypothetical protein